MENQPEETTDLESKTSPPVQEQNESPYSPKQIISKPPELNNPQKPKPRILSTTFNLFVGKIQDGIATLLSDDFNLIEIPLNVLPSDIRKGNILKLSIERNIMEEERRMNEIVFLQKILLEDENLFLKGTASN